MNSIRLNDELKRRGIELRLSNDRTRLGVGKGQKEKLTPEITAAIKENYDYLVRAELLKTAARDLHERITDDAGLSRDDPEYEAAYAAIGQGLPDDFLEDAWEGTVEGFRDALRDYFAPAYAALESALERGTVADTDEPELFGASAEVPADHLPENAV